MEITDRDLNFAVIPLSHSYGFSNLLTPLIVRGVSLALSSDRIPRAIIDGLAATHNYLRGRKDAFDRSCATLARLADRGRPVSAAISLTRDAIPVEVRMQRENGPKSTIQEARESAEREHILRALEESSWNVSGAARALGMERTNLHKRIRALGLTRGK